MLSCPSTETEDFFSGIYHLGWNCSWGRLVIVQHLTVYYLPLLKLKRDAPHKIHIGARIEEYLPFQKLLRMEKYINYPYLVWNISAIEDSGQIPILNESQTLVLACSDVLHLCGLLSPKNLQLSLQPMHMWSKVNSRSYYLLQRL